MSLTLVLVRHGKAQNKQPGQTDFDRELTGAGRKALSDDYPTTFAKIAERTDVELWVSPAVRAKQTASEVVASLSADLADERTLDCLYDQDASAFLQELKERIAAGPGCVVAVGHVPFMQDLSLYLGGYELPFSTGTVAAFELKHGVEPDGMGRPPARLLWFVQGPKA